MKWRFFSEEDYSMVCTWWEDWRWPLIPLQSLPKTGVIVSNGEKDICAAWIYKTDSNLCWIDWFISDRHASRQERKGTIELLIQICKGVAKDMGFDVAFCSVRNQSLIKKIESAGFIGKEEAMTNFIGVL